MERSRCGGGQGDGGWGLDRSKICRRVFDPNNNVTFFHLKLLLDNSSSFTSSLMKDLCQKWKVKLIFRSAWNTLMAWSGWLWPHPIFYDRSTPLGRGRADWRWRKRTSRVWNAVTEYLLTWSVKSRRESFNLCLNRAKPVAIKPEEEKKQQK